MKRRRKEFSKVILLFVSMVSLAVLIFSLYMIYSTGDLSPLAYIVPSVFAELAAATGFYYNKAKAENKIKLMRANGVRPDKNTFDNINNY